MDSLRKLLGGGLARAFGLARLGGGGARPFRLEAPEPPRPPLLVVEARGASVRIQPGSRGGIVVEGKRSPRGSVSLRVEEDPELGLVARVEVRGASARVEGPARALVVRARDSSVSAEPGAALEYASLRLASSGARLALRLRPGGGVALEADASAVRLELHPAEPGEYWVDAKARASALRVVAPEGTLYQLEPGAATGAEGVSLSVPARKSAAQPLYRVKVALKGRGAAVKLE